MKREEVKQREGEKMKGSEGGDEERRRKEKRQEEMRRKKKKKVNLTSEN